MADAWDITKGEEAGLLEAEVDTQGVRTLEAGVDTQDTQEVRRHTW